MYAIYAYIDPSNHPNVANIPYMERLGMESTGWLGLCPFLPRWTFVVLFASQVDSISGEIARSWDPTATDVPCAAGYAGGVRGSTEWEFGTKWYRVPVWC